MVVPCPRLWAEGSGLYAWAHAQQPAAESHAPQGGGHGHGHGHSHGHGQGLGWHLSEGCHSHPETFSGQQTQSPPTQESTKTNTPTAPHGRELPGQARAALQARPPRVHVTLLFWEAGECALFWVPRAPMLPEAPSGLRAPPGPGPPWAVVREPTPLLRATRSPRGKRPWAANRAWRALRASDPTGSGLEPQQAQEPGQPRAAGASLLPVPPSPRKGQRLAQPRGAAQPPGQRRVRPRWPAGPRPATPGPLTPTPREGLGSVHKRA